MSQECFAAEISPRISKRRADWLSQRTHLIYSYHTLYFRRLIDVLSINKHAMFRHCSYLPHHAIALMASGCKAKISKCTNGLNYIDIKAIFYYQLAFRTADASKKSTCYRVSGMHFKGRPLPRRVVRILKASMPTLPFLIISNICFIERDDSAERQLYAMSRVILNVRPWRRLMADSYQRPRQLI